MRMRNAECGMRNCTKRRPLRRSNIPRRGISLIEILVSIFVLLIGLSGVAFIFPVGNHYIVEGEKFDLGSNLAQNGFEELVARGILRPKAWLYADTAATFPFLNKANRFSRLFGKGKRGPGLAFVIDPLGSAKITALNGDLFPFGVVSTTSGVNMPPTWTGNFSTLHPASSFMKQPGTRWPIRRLTLPQAGGVPFTTPVAETIFRLRDDLATTQPNQDDLPSIQNWDLDNTTTPPTLLRRQYKGDYSWLATIVPTSSEALAALQPNTANNDYGEPRYDVSVVVFRRREVAPSVTSERLIRAKMINVGEVVVYGNDTTIVDAALDEIRPGNWIALTGVNQTTGVFMLKWYRILSRDKETSNYTPSSGGSQQPARYMTIDGPDWPNNSYTNLRAIILPGVITVVTHPLHMEDTSLWSLDRVQFRDL